MWKRTAKGLILTFHLAGINNQNFLMRDDQTGTFWQQISGRAISGPLAGYQLTPVYSDELSFALWRGEATHGEVLAPVPRYVKNYAGKDWDAHMQTVPTVLDFPNSGLRSRDLVLGIDAFGSSRAYPVSRILSAKLIEDRLGAEPILVIVGPDNASIRVFKARLRAGDAAPEYYRGAGFDSLSTGMPSSAPGATLFMDAATGSKWNFQGCAIAGPLKNSCLTPVPSIKDYWFDWRNYHPQTSIFRR